MDYLISLLLVDVIDGEEKYIDNINRTFLIPPVVGDTFTLGMGSFRVTERKVSIGSNPVIAAALKCVRY